VTLTPEQLILIIGGVAGSLTAALGALFRQLIIAQDKRIDEIAAERDFFREEYKTIRRTTEDTLSVVKEHVAITREAVMQLSRVTQDRGR
jgi:vacuolar-type H+-ATPase subunit I/STV1